MSKLLRDTVLRLIVLSGLVTCQVGLAVESETGEWIWAAGNEQGVYLVATREQDRQEGFQLLYRERIGNQFLYGPWYTGRPRCVTMHEDGLHLFFTDGVHRKYELHDSRTQRRIPVELEVLSAASCQDQLLVLVEVKKKQALPLSTLISDPIEVDSDPTTTRESSESGASEPVSEAITTVELKVPSIDVEAGEGLLLVLENNEWRSLMSTAIDLSGWDQPQIGVSEDMIHFFGIEDEGDRSPFAMILKEGQLHEPSKLPIFHLSALNALTVNRQFRLVVGQYNPTTEQGQDFHKVRRYYLGGSTQTGWYFSKALKNKTDTLIAGEPGQVAFAAMDQSLVVFERLSTEEIHLVSYDANDPSVPAIDEVVTLHTTELGLADYWLMSPEIFFSQAMLAAMILWWRRKDVLAGVETIPDFLEIAPLWRRAVAYVLDVLPASFFAQFITFKIYPAFSPDEIMAAMMSNQDLVANPSWIHGTSLYYAVFSFTATGYFLIWELFFYATPGKMLLRLQIITVGSQPPESYQVISRNFLRLLEMHPSIAMMVILPLLLFTPRHQRLGDLVSHTMVVTRKRGRCPDDGNGEQGLEDLYRPDKGEGKR